MKTERRLIFKVAALLGRTVGELENTMSSKELKEWGEYLSIEPTAADRMEIMLARLTDMYNQAHFKNKNSVIDYMLSLTAEEKEHIRQRMLIDKLKSIKSKRAKNGS